MENISQQIKARKKTSADTEIVWPDIGFSLDRVYMVLYHFYRVQ